MIRGGQRHRDSDVKLSLPFLEVSTQKSTGLGSGGPLDLVGCGVIATMGLVIRLKLVVNKTGRYGRPSHVPAIIR